MGGNVLVSLLVTRVLGDEVEVFSSDDDGSVHLGGNDGAGQDTATDGDETGEGALLVCSQNVSNAIQDEVVWSPKLRKARSNASPFSSPLECAPPPKCFPRSNVFQSHIPM